MRISKLAALSSLALVLTLGTVTLEWLPAGTPAGTKPLPAAPTSVLLLTLDTTRADALGAYFGNGLNRPRTPVLDGLAARGVRWTRAITPTPLTLPAHSSLFTGLAPPEHGVAVNGREALPRDVPTLAGAFTARGYRTAGLVATLVLDRRFGLARGFQHYDDEVPGEQGAERDARQMTDAALEWLQARPAGKPLFLWVHYYDPHEPYRSRDADPKAGAAELYAGEVAFMDREIGRLLAALPGGAERWLIAAVADHGESFGEHGERGHGLFLYQPTVHVPLILAGPGVPRGKAVATVASTSRLAATLLRLTGAGQAAGSFGEELPGAPGLSGTSGRGRGAAGPVYLASRYTLTAHGWSPLEGMLDGRFKLIVAPRPELYDLAADPGETRNLLNGPREQWEPARRLKGALAATRRSFKVHTPDTAATADPELTRALESLGYVSGSGAARGKGTLDPKDGILMLADLAAAQEMTREGNPQAAVASLTKLVPRNPGNAQFLTALAEAQLASGDGAAAIATYRRAAEENPRRDDVHRNLAGAYAHLGRQEEARKEYEIALALNPRSAANWLGLADLAQKAGRPAEVRRLLGQAVNAGTRSVAVLMRLAEAEARAGNGAAAERHFQQAAELAPDRPPAWMALGKIAESQGKLDRALQFYLKAAQAGPREPAPLLRAGHVLHRKGDGKGARQALEKVITIAPGSAEAREARGALLSRPLP